MSVWVAMPSARPVEEVNARLEKWRRMGYKVALWRDHIYAPDSGAFAINCAEIPSDFHCDLLIVAAKYPGYYAAANGLVDQVFLKDQTCDWVVCAADDMDPDASKPADEIAWECSVNFGTRHDLAAPLTPGTFGVMQPTGDRWGEHEPWAKAQHPTRPAYADRICGSPWIGREFARRVNLGKGPWWPEYLHMFGDEELLNVAEKLGVLWQRRDVIHYHDHCRRDGVARTPAFLTEAYGPAHWTKYQELFARRKMAGFPGSELIA